MAQGNRPDDADRSLQTTADDVDHDEAALARAEDRMHAHREGANQPHVKDPTGDHDEAALDEAARRFAAER